MVGQGSKVLRRIAVLVATLAIAGLVFGGSALAQTQPSGYQGAGSGTQEKVGSAGVQSQSQQAPAARTIGSLPFTGFDLAVAVGGGLLLILAGTAIRRSSKRARATTGT